MSTYASYTINIIGNDVELKSISIVVAEAFDDTSYVGENPIEIEDTDIIVWDGEIRELAIDMAKAAPNAGFSIRGTTDTSESSGEYQDFLFEYKDGKISECCSCWYIPLEADEYDNLETIIISNSAIRIGEDAFGGSKKLTIKAPADSTAEEYAKMNGIPFEAL